MGFQKSWGPQALQELVVEVGNPLDSGGFLYLNSFGNTERNGKTIPSKTVDTRSILPIPRKTDDYLIRQPFGVDSSTTFKNSRRKYHPFLSCWCLSYWHVFFHTQVVT
jgi:hypothetical protein